MAQPGSALPSGGRGRRFESSHTDQYFFKIIKVLWLSRRPLQAEFYGRTTVVQHLVRQIDAYSPDCHTLLKFFSASCLGRVYFRHGGPQTPVADTDDPADTLENWI